MPYDIIYSRFTWHSITLEQENQILQWIKDFLHQNSLLFIEVRGIKDELFSKGRRIGNDENYTDHYRRFMNLDIFLPKLKDIGLKPVFCIEETGLAVHGDEDPMIIRIIATPQ